MREKVVIENKEADEKKKLEALLVAVVVEGEEKDKDEVPLTPQVPLMNGEEMTTASESTSETSPGIADVSTIMDHEFWTPTNQFQPLNRVISHHST